MSQKSEKSLYTRKTALMKDTSQSNKYPWATLNITQSWNEHEDVFQLLDSVKVRVKFKNTKLIC